MEAVSDRQGDSYALDDFLKKKKQAYHLPHNHRHHVVGLSSGLH